MSNLFSPSEEHLVIGLHGVSEWISSWCKFYITLFLELTSNCPMSEQKQLSYTGFHSWGILNSLIWERTLMKTIIYTCNRNQIILNQITWYYPLWTQRRQCFISSVPAILIVANVCCLFQGQSENEIHKSDRQSRKQWDTSKFWMHSIFVMFYISTYGYYFCYYIMFDISVKIEQFFFQ